MVSTRQAASSISCHHPSEIFTHVSHSQLTDCLLMTAVVPVAAQFHALEYPRYDPKVFPINLGNCQNNSTSPFDARSMDVRNIVYYQVPGAE